VAVGITITDMQTAVTLYTLVMAMLMITGGKIGSMIGRRRAFAIECVIYGLGSLTTALAPRPWAVLAHPTRTNAQLNDLGVHDPVDLAGIEPACGAVAVRGQKNRVEILAEGPEIVVSPAGRRRRRFALTRSVARQSLRGSKTSHHR
jgi:hypothetical protein